MKPPAHAKLKAFHATIAAALLRQGIRPTARKLDCHPSAVRRIHNALIGGDFPDVLALIYALGGSVNLVKPDLAKLTPVKMGRPRHFFTNDC